MILENTHIRSAIEKQTKDHVHRKQTLNYAHGKNTTNAYANIQQRKGLCTYIKQCQRSMHIYKNAKDANHINTPTNYVHVTQTTDSDHHKPTTDYAHISTTTDDEHSNTKQRNMVIYTHTPTQRTMFSTTQQRTVFIYTKHTNMRIENKRNTLII